MKFLPVKRNRLENEFWSPFQWAGDDLFRDFFKGDFNPEAVASSFAPALNVAESAKFYEVNVELPGVEAKDVEVSLEGDLLTIKGEKKEVQESKDKNFHRVESHYGKFSRALRLPIEVEQEAISANFKNGVLELTLPKSKNAGPKKIEISS